MTPKGRKVSSDEEVSDIWSKIIGPAYDREGLQQGFGYTAEQIDAMLEANAILELVTADGAALYPAACFDEDGRPPPRLPEIISDLRAKGIANPWGLAMWLSSKPLEWDGRSAFELLRTEWSEEVVNQAAEHGRSPLWARSWQAEQMMIARPILDRFVELISELPVRVGTGTLFVTRETDVPYGVFAMSLGEGPQGMRMMSFRIDGSPEQRAKDLAALVAAQIAGTANDLNVRRIEAPKGTFDGKRPGDNGRPEGGQGALGATSGSNIFGTRNGDHQADP